MCLIILVAFLGPRLLLFLWWLGDQAMWSTTFNNAILPLLGFFFFPWTTVFYVVVAPGGVVELDWLLIGFGMVLDVVSAGAGWWKRRNAWEGYQAPPPGPMAPP